MKSLFWIVALFALAVGLVLGALYNDGYALLVLPPYRVEVSLNLLILVAALTFLLFYTVVRLVTTAVLMPSRVRAYRLARRRTSAHEALVEALRSYFEGRYAQAEQSARQAIDLGEHTRVSRVLAARAAHELRAYDRRDAYLDEAAQQAPAGDALHLVTQAELLLSERRAREALEVLRSLPRKHTAALRLEFKALQQLRRSDEVVSLISELERRGVFDVDQAAKLRTHAYADAFKRTGPDALALDEAWKKIPDTEKRSTIVASAAAKCYLAAGRKREAQTIIEASLGQAWDGDLLGLYPDCAGPETVRQIERAEAWLDEHPRDASLLLALGRLCAHQELWGKAESYLEASVSLDPTYKGHLELARLHERLGNADAARRHYRRSLELALDALDEPATSSAYTAHRREARALGSVDALEIEQRR